MNLSEHYPQAYLEYLVYFHGARDYFECHEVLEAYWKANPNDPLQDAYVGLIQLAVGFYHHRRGNLGGAQKMLASACHKLSIGQVTRLGLDAVQLDIRIKESLERLQSLDPTYEDISLPFIDQVLLAYCQELSDNQGLTWNQSSCEIDQFLYEKHRLRDRSGVIAERNEQILRKSMARTNHP